MGTKLINLKGLKVRVDLKGSRLDQKLVYFLVKILKTRAFWMIDKTLNVKSQVTSKIQT